MAPKDAGVLQKIGVHMIETDLCRADKAYRTVSQYSAIDTAYRSDQQNIGLFEFSRAQLSAIAAMNVAKLAKSFFQAWDVFIRYNAHNYWFLTLLR